MSISKFEALMLAKHKVIRYVLTVLCPSAFLYIHVRNGSLEFKDAECDHIRLSPLAVFGIFIESVNVSIDPLLNLFRILSVIGEPWNWRWKWGPALPVR